jgi:hypothetical protein
MVLPVGCEHRLPLPRGMGSLTLSLVSITRQHKRDQRPEEIKMAALGKVAVELNQSGGTLELGCGAVSRRDFQSGCH